MLWQSIILNGQPRQVERFVGHDLAPLRLKLLGAVLLRHLPQQFEPRILYTVSVNILNIYHKENIYEHELPRIEHEFLI